MTRINFSNFIRTVCALLLVAALVLGALAAIAGAKRTKPIKKPRWLPRTTITEYYPVPEKWFIGAAVDTPGLSRQSRIDWLYSARGMSMEGDGVGLDGRRYHIDNVGSSGWITRKGKRAEFGTNDADRAPFWRGSGYWRNRRKGVTFPLLDGSWFAGKGKRYVPPGDITFGEGPSRDLRYYRSVAVDPQLIPLGSIVWVGEYQSLNRDGWLRADDVGGAIIGRHIDVYRKAPSSKNDTGRYYDDARIYVVPARRAAAYVDAERVEDTDGLPAPPRSILR